MHSQPCPDRWTPWSSFLLTNLWSQQDLHNLSTGNALPWLEDKSTCTDDPKVYASVDEKWDLLIRIFLLDEFLILNLPFWLPWANEGDFQILANENMHNMTNLTERMRRKGQVLALLINVLNIKKKRLGIPFVQLSYRPEPDAKLFQNFAYQKLSQGSNAQVNSHVLDNIKYWQLLKSNMYGQKNYSPIT